MNFPIAQTLVAQGFLAGILLHNSGWPRFGLVRLRFGGGAVRAVLVLGSGSSSREGGFSVFQYGLTDRDGSSFGS